MGESNVAGYEKIAIFNQISLYLGKDTRQCELQQKALRNSYIRYLLNAAT